MRFVDDDEIRLIRRRAASRERFHRVEGDRHLRAARRFQPMLTDGGWRNHDGRGRARRERESDIRLAQPHVVGEERAAALIHHSAKPAHGIVLMRMQADCAEPFGGRRPEHVRRDRIETLLGRSSLPNSESKFLFYFLNAKLFVEEFAQ